MNTYLVQVTQSNTTYGADIAELFRYRANEHGLFIQDRLTPIPRLVLNLGLRYETNSSYQPASCRPVTQFAPEECYGAGDGAVVRVVLSAPQRRLRRDRRRPDGAEVLGQPLQPAAQHQHHRAAEPDGGRQYGHQRSAVMGRRQQRSHSAVERDRAVARLRLRRRQRPLRGRSEAAGLERVHVRIPARAARRCRSVGRLHLPADPPEHCRDRHHSDARIVGRTDHGDRTNQRRSRPGVAARHRATARACSTTRRRWI